MAALTPEQVAGGAAALAAPSGLHAAVVPGERTEDGGPMGGWGDEGSVAPPTPDAKAPVAAASGRAAARLPPVAPVGDLTFPAVEHARLSNGIPVTLARRTAIPKVSLALDFDAGNAADGGARAGMQSLMMEMLEEGTTTRSADRDRRSSRSGSAPRSAAAASTDTSTVSHDRADRQPRPVARADGRRRAQPGVRAGRSRAGQGPAPGRDRAGAGQTRWGWRSARSAC